MSIAILIARGGFTDTHQWNELKVEVPSHLRSRFSDEDWQVVIKTPSLDPCPHYHNDEARQYGMPFMGSRISFSQFSGVSAAVRCGIVRFLEQNNKKVAKNLDC